LPDGEISFRTAEISIPVHEIPQFRDGDLKSWDGERRSRGPGGHSCGPALKLRDAAMKCWDGNWLAHRAAMKLRDREMKSRDGEMKRWDREVKLGDANRTTARRKR